MSALEGVDATAARLTAESQRLREKLEQSEGQVGRGDHTHDDVTDSITPSHPSAVPISLHTIPNRCR